MANDDTEGCLGCLGLLIIGVIICGIISAIQAYADAARTDQAALGVLTAVPTGLIAGGLVGLFTGKYRQKSKLGPLPFLSYLRSTSRLRQTYLPGSVTELPPDQGTSSEEPIKAEIVEEEGDTQEANSGQAELHPGSKKRCPKCGFHHKWDGTRCGHCHYVAASH